MFLSAGCCLLGAEGFSRNLDVLHWRSWEENSTFKAENFSIFWSLKTLDPDPH
jgi:hypothetical protein